ncbi:MAG TPA: hypothetical protein VMV59_10435 [Candidatus Dormibacteraeota bacterium]|nr:hypothetical protein [Candidatus Dormibacteraeota bacterium]
MTGMRDIPAKGYCCSSWRSLCFWGCAFVVFYAAALLVIYRLHMQSYQASTLFAALGLACVTNAARNRTFHCVITGPFFLLVALAFALNTAGVWRIPTEVLWATVVIVVCAALLLERRFAS